MLVGKRNSGKSEFIEKLLQRYDNRLYFATLWEDADTALIIQRHAIRRDNKWILAVSSGLIAEDMKVIAQMLNQMPEPRYCLIDGLLNWCLNCARPDGNYLETAGNLSIALANLINNHGNTFWYLVDARKEDFAKYPYMTSMWNILHSNLRLYVEGLENWNWG